MRSPSKAGAGTVAFLVGVGWFDMGAFQVRQFLLTSYAHERALLCAVAQCFDAAALLVTYNGKTQAVREAEVRRSGIRQAGVSGRWFGYRCYQEKGTQAECERHAADGREVAVKGAKTLRIPGNLIEQDRRRRVA